VDADLFQQVHDPPPYSITTQTLVQSNAFTQLFFNGAKGLATSSVLER
jgi:hypothetical protein